MKEILMTEKEMVFLVLFYFHAKMQTCQRQAVPLKVAISRESANQPHSKIPGNDEYSTKQRAKLSDADHRFL